MSDDNGKRVSISRRQALASMGTVGAVVGIGGLGTMAQFTDTEEDAVTFTAGAIDGTVEAGGRYNGTVLQDFSGQNFTENTEIENVGFEETGALGLDMTLDDVKPGDYGCFSFRITVENNPAWVAACLGYEDSTDGTIFEPEIEPDDDLNDSDFEPLDDGSGQPGELDENILVIPFYKGNSGPGPDPFDPCIFFDSEADAYNWDAYNGAQAVACPSDFWDNATGSLTPSALQDVVGQEMNSTQVWDTETQPTFCEFEDAISVGDGCVFLNGELTSDTNEQPAAPLAPGNEIWFGWDWHIPFGAGNELQGDELTLQLGFNFGQVRHTEDATLQNIYAPGANTPNSN